MSIALQIKGISKTYGDKVILNHIDFTLEKGSIHAIIGENGAGKTTIVKILSGLIKPDAGKIRINNEPALINSARDSLEYGISTVQQDVNLFDNFSVAENICAAQRADREKRGFLINHKKMINEAQTVLEMLGLDIDPSKSVEYLNIAQKHIVQIAKAIWQNSKIIILDEPISTMSKQEQDSFFSNLKGLMKRAEVSIIYVSQRLEDAIQIADEITVIRNGKVTGHLDNKEIDNLQIIKMLSGDCYVNRYPKLKLKQGKEVFAVENLSLKDLLNDITFSLNQREILGITGLIGSGRSILAKTIFGLLQKTTGNIYLDRLEAEISSPQKAIDLGLAYITEDRLSDGLFMNLNALYNICVFNKQHNPFINKKYEIKNFYHRAERINLNPLSPNMPVMNFSGGNQQKILLLRWFQANFRVFIFDEPTKNIDTVSKIDIYNLMNDILRKNGSIILISTDIEELIGMCDRIIVLRKGEISTEVIADEASYEKLYKYL